MTLALAVAACSSPTQGTGSRIGAARPTNGPTTTNSSTLPSATGGAVSPTAPAASGSQSTHVIQTTSAGAAGSGLKDGQCAKQNIVISRVVPTIWLVIDGSGSMLSPLGGGSAQSRWSALYDALMNPDSGVVKSLEKDVQWGVVLYDGPPPGGMPMQVALPDGGVKTFPPAETCPRVVVSEPKKEAFADISMIVGIDPLGGSTPTDRALDVVVNHLPDLTGQALDMRVFPTIVVLATDGEPNDFCNVDPFLGIPLGGDVRPKVLSAVQQLESMSVKTYVISLAGGDQGLTAHLNQVAAAGGTGLPPFFPTTKDQLVQAFKDIVGPETACEVVLNGAVKPGIECMGKIKINGVELACNDPNGWALKDPSTVVIQGTACEQYKMDLSTVLEADFPCELIDLN
jgi:hypothetical protein